MEKMQRVDEQDKRNNITRWLQQWYAIDSFCIV